MTDVRDVERLAALLANRRSRVHRDEEDGHLFVLLNDFFVPAADAEDIPSEAVPDVLNRWERQGWWGILDWVIRRRYMAEGPSTAGWNAPNNVVACVSCKQPVQVTALNAIRCEKCAEAPLTCYDPSHIQPPPTEADEPPWQGWFSCQDCGGWFNVEPIAYDSGDEVCGSCAAKREEPAPAWLASLLASYDGVNAPDSAVVIEHDDGLGHHILVTVGNLRAAIAS